jgi:glycosyltransferase involved in cell wall biosynthesis
LSPLPPPRVSVVLPAWNRAGSIRMAVESVLRQTFADFELLVVDDGSTDGTIEALAEIDDSRLRCLANPRNMGPSAARNTGIRAAKAEWVAFQDSDDEWLPQKLAKQMEALGPAPDPDVVACYTGMAILGQHKQTSGARTALTYVPSPEMHRVDGDLQEPLLAGSFISTQMLMARRSALLEINGFDETLPALVDWDCAIRLSRHGRFLFVDEPLVLQTFSDNSITRNRRKWLQARLAILEKHHPLLSRRPRILAGHHVAIAGEQRRSGDLAAARRSLMAALRLQPASPALWLRLSRICGLSLLRRKRAHSSP